MSKFLVTGGAGFIGSNIAEELIKQGHFVRVLDNLTTGKQENVDALKELGKDNFNFLHGDIISPIDCEKACQSIDYVIHQAALISVPKSLREPLKYNKVNIDGTINILQASSNHSIKRLVFASSSSVYGNAVSFPEKESDLPQPVSPYALSKLAGEHYCNIYSEFFGVETVCLRYFNIFGPRQSMVDDYSAVIPKFINFLLNNEQPTVYGTGLQSRDFTYINNVVSANILAATTPGIKHEVFNVANGADNTVLNLANTLNRILGKNIQPKFLPVRSGDVPRSQGDISKISRMINYQPLVGFEEGLRRTTEYFKAKWNK
jgi:nucleoside-diphosphate-sugar epimerase